MSFSCVALTQQVIGSKRFKIVTNKWDLRVLSAKFIVDISVLADMLKSTNRFLKLGYNS